MRGRAREGERERERERERVNNIYEIFGDRYTTIGFCPSPIMRYQVANMYCGISN